MKYWTYDTDGEFMMRDGGHQYYCDVMLSLIESLKDEQRQAACKLDDDHIDAAGEWNHYLEPGELSYETHWLNEVEQIGFKIEDVTEEIKDYILDSEWIEHDGSAGCELYDDSRPNDFDYGPPPMSYDDVPF